MVRMRPRDGCVGRQEGKQRFVDEVMEDVKLVIVRKEAAEDQSQLESDNWLRKRKRKREEKRRETQKDSEEFQVHDPLQPEVPLASSHCFGEVAACAAASLHTVTVRITDCHPL